MWVSSILLAVSAAYYSVFGLSSLFAGAKYEVMILASSLEFSKLITASYLHSRWNQIGWLKYYLSVAVVVLMIITSAGIYGFLTSAYQETANKVSLMDSEIKVIELKKDRWSTQLSNLNDEKVSLSKSISELSNGIANNVIEYRDPKSGKILRTTSNSTRRTLERQLEETKQRRDTISLKIVSLTDSITKLDLSILNIQQESEVTAEIGTLKYLSKITGKPMDVIVNWFTLLIIFVFDPLAIAMVISLNKTSKRKKLSNDVDLDSEVDLPIQTPIDNSESKVEVEDNAIKTNEIVTKPKVTKKAKSNNNIKRRYSDSDKYNQGN